MSRNVLNVEEVEKYVKALSKRAENQPHVEKWLTATFRNHILYEAQPCKPVIDKRELNSPLAQMMKVMFTQLLSGSDKPSVDTLLNTGFHAIDVDEHPEWVARTLTERKQELVWIDVANQPREEHAHLVDYLQTLKEKAIFSSVEEVQRGVVAWDKFLAKQKVLGKMAEGVQIMESDLVSAFNIDDERLVMVKLKTKDSYVREGAAMRHCVGGKSYYGKSHIEIYSLRRVLEGQNGEALHEPIVTIEVRVAEAKSKSSVFKKLAKAVKMIVVRTAVQVQGKGNKPAEEKYMSLVTAWFEEQAIRVDLYSDQPDDDDDEAIADDDEDDEDEDDEDDDDDEEGDDDEDWDGDEEDEEDERDTI